jgi:hypothetical protein
MEGWNNGVKCILSLFIKRLFRFKTQYSNIPPFQYSIITVAEKKKVPIKELNFSIRYRNSEALL